MATIQDLYELSITGNAGAKLAELDKSLSEVTRTFEAQTDRLDKYRGQVDALSDRLRLFGERGIQAANLVDEISDPIERARVASELFQRELQRGGGVWDGLNNKLLEARAKFAALPPLLQGAVLGGVAAVAAGVTALTAAVGKFVTQGIERAIKTAPSLQVKLEDLESATDRTAEAFGRAFLEGANFEGILTVLTETAAKSEAAVKSNADTVRDLGELFRQVFAGVVYAASFAISGGLTPLAITLDAVRFGVQGLIVVLSNLALAAGEVGLAFGTIEEETVQGLRVTARATSDTLAEMESLTKKLWEGGSAARDFADGILDVGSAAVSSGQKLGENLAGGVRKVIEAFRTADDVIAGEHLKTIEDTVTSYRKAGADLVVLESAFRQITDSVQNGSMTAEQARDSWLSLTAGIQTGTAEMEKARDKQGKAGDKYAKQREALLIKEQEGVADYLNYWLAALDLVDGAASGIVTSLNEARFTFTDLGDTLSVIDQITADGIITDEEIARAYELGDAYGKIAEEGQKRLEQARAANDQMKKDEEAARRMGSALDSIRTSAIDTGIAIADLAISTAIAGEGFAAFAEGALSSLGSFASQAGRVLFFTGLGLEAIATAFPGGAIAAGLGLMAVGSVIGGLVSSSFSGGGAQDASSRVIDEVRSAADRRAREDERRDRELPPIILKIGTREFGEAIMDTQRRGYA